MEVTVTLNDWVSVVLTKEGEAIYKQTFIKAGLEFLLKNHSSYNSETKTLTVRLHELFAIFGIELYSMASNLPFVNNQLIFKTNNMFLNDEEININDLEGE